MDITKQFGISIGKPPIRDWTQDFVPVEYIKDGVLILEGKYHKRYVKIVEIIPLNFAIKTEAEQDMVILNYARWLKVAPNSFQIKVVTSATDVNRYLNLAKKALSGETNEGCREAIRNYIAYLQNAGLTKTTERHYYLIFEYEPQQFHAAASTEDQVINALNERASQIKGNFRDIGNEVLCYTYSENSDCDIDLAELLYKHYNRRTSATQPFESRVNRIETDAAKLLNITTDDLPVSNIKSLLAPKSIDTEESPDYMVVDGLYRGFFYIKSNSYPSTMSTLGGWLAQVMTFGVGYEADMFFAKADAKQKIMAIRNHSKWAKYALNNTEAEQLDSDAKMNNYQGTMYMKKALTSWNEDVYEMSVMVTIHGYTKEDFYKRRSLMMEAAVKLGLGFGECKRFQEEGFFSNGFYNMLSPKIYNLSHRNITTSGVAAAYGFTSFSLADAEGVAIGRHDNGSLVVYDPFDAKKYANANIAVYGATGHGKTYSLLTLITRLRCLGIPNFVLSPEKQEEFMRVVEAVDGEFIDMANTSPHRINIFDIMPMDSPSAKVLGGSTYVEQNWLTNKIENIKIWISYVVIRKIKQDEDTIIGEILYSMYKDFGITDDNDSIYLDKATGVLKEMPIMEDFYKRLCDNPNIPKDLKQIFSIFITGEAKNMNGHTNVNLNNKFIVFGLEHVSKRFLAPTLFIVLEYVWAKCKQDRTQKKMITIDEGWELLKGDNEQVGAFVEQIFKLIRGYGGGAIFATQSICDLFQGKNNYGNAILSCSHSKILLGMEVKDLDMISEELGLTINERNKILAAPVGSALLCAGVNHIPITIEASSYEHRLFTTRRADLEKMAKGEI